MTLCITRRTALLLAAACASPAAPGSPGPGTGRTDARPSSSCGNGDNAALWMTTLWRLESNGWPRERCTRSPCPTAARAMPTTRRSPAVPRARRRRALAAEVDAVLQRSGASQVVLVGNSRGGIVIRNCRPAAAAEGVARDPGRAPNHGAWSSASFRPTSEFNGAAAAHAAEQPGRRRHRDHAGAEVADHPLRQQRQVRSARRRVDRRRHADPRDRFAGPALKGAQNVVIAGIDHRETAFGPQAFAAMWRFLTGSELATTRAVPEARHHAGRHAQRRSGGQPAAGRRRRRGLRHRSPPAHGSGAALHRQTVGADGRWGRSSPPARPRWSSSSRRRAMPSRMSTARPSRARRNWCTARRAHRRRRPRRAGGGDADAAARLLRHPARRDRARRPQPAGRHSRRRGRRAVHGQGRRLADGRKRAGPAPSTANASSAAAGRRRATTWCFSNCMTRKKRPTLAQVLFSQGFGTRRECESLVAAGLVSLAGEVCDDPGARSSPRAWSSACRAALAYRERAGDAAQAGRLRVLAEAQAPPQRAEPAARAAAARGVQPVGRLDETPPASCCSPTTAR